MCPTIVNNVETLCHVKHIIAHGRRGIRQARHAQQHRHAHPLRQRRRAEARLLRGRSRQGHDGRADQRPLRRPEARPQAQGRHPRRLARPKSCAPTRRSLEEPGQDPRDRRARGHPDGLRHPRRLRLDGRLRRRDRHGRLARHGWVLEQHQRLLRPRKLRPVHALPRRLAVDEENHRPHRRRQAAPEDVDAPEERGRQIDGKTICAFGEACSWPTQSFVLKFERRTGRRHQHRLQRAKPKTRKPKRNAGS